MGRDEIFAFFYLPYTFLSSFQVFLPRNHQPSVDMQDQFIKTSDNVPMTGKMEKHGGLIFHRGYKGSSFYRRGRSAGQISEGVRQRERENLIHCWHSWTHNSGLNNKKRIERLVKRGVQTKVAEGSF